jgi:L-alanine-DL-glutamate epimerase-like enolase superfamily enzyme
VTLLDRIAGLPLTVEAVRLERRQVQVGGFTRVTTTVILEGGGRRGEGEDVSWDPADHARFPELPLAGRRTLSEWSDLLEGRDLYAGSPSSEAARGYRRWALESAALDLALRQAGRSLAEALGRVARPVRFVVSAGGPVDEWLALYPDVELKLDAGPDWDAARLERLAATGRVRVVDMKAHYVGDWVQGRPDPALHRAVAEALPDVIIEDPRLEGDFGEALRGAEGRVSFDAPIHSLADVDVLGVDLRWLNVKPSRFGSIERLLECVEACENRGIRMYGGGQFELGPGRRQIQTLAAVFYPEGPNDVAPTAYNLGGPHPGLPASPLPAPAGPGF